jgi:hypothetical protein
VLKEMLIDVKIEGNKIVRVPYFRDFDEGEGPMQLWMYREDIDLAADEEEGSVSGE